MKLFSMWALMVMEHPDLPHLECWLPEFTMQWSSGTGLGRFLTTSVIFKA